MNKKLNDISVIRLINEYYEDLVLEKDTLQQTKSIVINFVNDNKKTEKDNINRRLILDWLNEIESVN